ncbi:MAG: 16S rRNA (guanine(527)-N(7))-methyltransferase RsmG [Pseudomonadota bacterium]|nr:16S rRNA (guanine(527)-N(7))-methyltransferase RsmG [Pseudomonadota bacterium]MEC8019636.1 16S rRNA (guanine(527)-N(7))-methyltransferase RsmG [Pseudomonadota bacterium]MEC8498027.1 16S rRNA (guanine(527)-N(7))-methyltransferase RsmG [Pseudomonadota bacterium]
MSDYIDLVVDANKKFNLISKSTEKNIWDRHITDSAQLLNHLPNGTKTICDVGSGAGFPGIVLKIINTSLSVTIVEPSKKKSEFLKFVSKELDLDLNIVQEKYENIKKGQMPFFDVITARALKPLDKLIHLFFEDLRQGSVCVFPKGENWQNELDLAQNNWLLKYSVETSITNKGSKIFIIKGVKRRNE